MKNNKKKSKKSLESGKYLLNCNPKIKISELISAYASDYINMGNNSFERQSNLNGACSAWNIAVLPEYLRETALKQHIEQYTKINPGIDDAENVKHDMQILIQKKLEMFPDIKKVIVDAFIEPIDDTQYSIKVISTDKPEQLKQILT